VLYAVTKLNSVDVRSLCSCMICGRMSLSSVVCVCVCVCVCARAPGVPVLVKSGHTVYKVESYKMTISLQYIL